MYFHVAIILVASLTVSGSVFPGDKNGSRVTTVVATPGQGPDQSQEVSYTDTEIGRAHV